MSTTQNADLTIGYTSFTAPLGSVVDHIEVTATGPSSPPAQSVAPGTTTVTFLDLTPGSYTFTAQAFPASGPGFGTAVSVTLTIVATTVTLQIPGTLTADQP